MKLTFSVQARNGTHWVEAFNADDPCPTCPVLGIKINARSRKHGQEIADALTHVYELGRRGGADDDANHFWP